jgi:hypothetical protein
VLQGRRWPIEASCRCLVQNIAVFRSLATDLIFLYNKIMIYYRLFRKEASVRSTLEFGRPEITESKFIEEISRMIKLLKRREKLVGEL